MRSLAIGASGMMAQSTNVEVISNNIANMTTTGFQRKRAEFQDLLYQDQRRVGATSANDGSIVPAGISIGLGVKTAATYRITEQGNMQQTGNTYDMGIRGKGYFQIELPNGETAYTRAGAFQLSPDGTIVNQDGFVVAPGLTVPNDAIDVTISPSGEVQAKIDGQVDLINVGQLELAIFPNDAGLQSIGDNLLLETPASGAAQVNNPGEPGYGQVIQFFLENSNVNVVSEITNLITAQRAYEMNSKVIQTTDEMMSTTNQVS